MRWFYQQQQIFIFRIILYIHIIRYALYMAAFAVGWKIRAVLTKLIVSANTSSKVRNSETLGSSFALYRTTVVCMLPYYCIGPGSLLLWRPWPSQLRSTSHTAHASSLNTFSILYQCLEYNAVLVERNISFILKRRRQCSCLTELSKQ